MRRLRDVVRRCAERGPMYRTRLPPHAHGLLRTLDDVAALPFTTKQDLRDRYPLGMLAVAREDVVRVHASSGTKGKPTVVAYTRGDVEMWTEVCARALAAGGAQPGDVVHNAYGYGLFT